MERVRNGKRERERERQRERERERERERSECEEHCAYQLRCFRDTEK